MYCDHAVGCLVQEECDSICFKVWWKLGGGEWRVCVNMPLYNGVNIALQRSCQLGGAKTAAAATVGGWRAVTSLSSSARAEGLSSNEATKTCDPFGLGWAS